MLRRLEIKNYAIIESLDLTIDKGLTIITGETGAGKSILLGALGLIMGKRADSKVLYIKDQKCVVEATFEIKDYDLKSWFDEKELDYEDEVIIRRSISTNGKSRAFINDEPAKLSLLKSLTDELVDMHQQFDTLDIHSISFQTNTVDALAGNLDLMKNYRTSYNQYSKHKQELAILLEKQRSANNEIEFFKFQMSEFNEMELMQGEQLEKEQTLERLNNSEGIQQVGKMISHQLELSDANIIDQIRLLNNELDNIKGSDTDLGKLSERLTEVMEEMSDISRTAEDIADSTEYDGNLIAELSERLDGIYKLQQKHSVNTLTELLEVQDGIQEKLSGYGDLTTDIKKVEKEIKKDVESLTKVATKVSKNRKSAVPKMEKQIKGMLSSLSMEHAELKIELERLEELGASGLDRAVFYFKANKGGDFNLLKNVASGGEISRLTLCLKSIIADTTVLPTLIFDEIDTGVSGDVAGKMGSILHKLSTEHQVLSITHSPQIASRADKHFFVYKEDKADRTVTGIKELAGDDKIIEIAKMLSGNPPSDAAIENAKGLLQN